MKDENNFWISKREVGVGYLLSNVFIPQALFRSRLLKSKLLDFIVEHHASILVFEVVAVEDELALEFREPNNDAHLFPWKSQHGIFPAFLPGLYCTAPAIAVQPWERPGMQVHWVRFQTIGVVEFPDFDRSGLHHHVAAIGIEALAIGESQVKLRPLLHPDGRAPKWLPLLLWFHLHIAHALHSLHHIWVGGHSTHHHFAFGRVHVAHLHGLAQHRFAHSGI